ncbi:MAG: hypothetical protein IPN71_08475 [Fibrobacteres bacterium]|nr:hypothetical protein [Fibrobacterota bacterium]
MRLYARRPRKIPFLSTDPFLDFLKMRFHVTDPTVDLHQRFPGLARKRSLSVNGKNLRLSVTPYDICIEGSPMKVVQKHNIFAEYSNRELMNLFIRRVQNALAKHLDGDNIRLEESGIANADLTSMLVFGSESERDQVFQRLRIELRLLSLDPSQIALARTVYDNTLVFDRYGKGWCAKFYCKDHEPRYNRELIRAGDPDPACCIRVEFSFNDKNARDLARRGGAELPADGEPFRLGDVVLHAHSIFEGALSQLRLMNFQWQPERDTTRPPPVLAEYGADWYAWINHAWPSKMHDSTQAANVERLFFNAGLDLTDLPAQKRVRTKLRDVLGLDLGNLFSPHRRVRTIVPYPQHQALVQRNPSR